MNNMELNDVFLLYHFYSIFFYLIVLYEILICIVLG